MEYISEFNTLKMEEDKCVGCGLCQTVCPLRVIEVINRKATLQHPKRCIECGACMSNCPTSAVTVEAGVGCAQAIFNGGSCNC